MSCVSSSLVQFLYVSPDLGLLGNGPLASPAALGAELYQIIKLNPIFQTTGTISVILTEKKIFDRFLQNMLISPFFAENTIMLTVIQGENP